VLVRQAPQLDGLAGQKRTERHRTIGRPTRALSIEGLDEGPVLEEEVISLERWRLIQRVAHSIGSGHGRHARDDTHRASGQVVRDG
jgi:hypothetical protein